MLSGRSAFQGETVSDTIAAILGREVDWAALPGNTPASVRRLLPRLLEKDQRRRLRDIADARSDLEAQDGVAAPATGRAGRPGMSLIVSAGIATLALSALAYVAGTRAGRVVSDPVVLGPSFRPITNDASFSTEPALSPDGTLVVYASDRAGVGQLDLWLQRVDGGQPIRLTSDSADDREPSFSPDGRLIAFRSNRGTGGVYVMPALGGDARLVVEGGWAPRFSPDGTRLAYWRGPWLAGPHATPSSLFVVPSIGGASVAVADDFTYARNAVWSFDGRGLIFFGGRRPPGGAAELDWWWTALDKTVPVATGVYPLLKARGLSGTFENNTQTPEFDALPSSWTRAGVIFSAQLDGSVNLWRVTIDEDTGQVEGDSLVRLTAGVGSDINGSADANGRVAFQVEEANNVSLTLPLDPLNGKALGPPVRRTTDRLMADGRNSLDAIGRLLAYPRRNGTQSEIWLKDLTTGAERPVITTPLGQLNPVLSPDGRQVGYTLLEQGRGTGYIVGVGGGTPRRICVGCNLQGWFSDNRRILTVSRDPNRVGVVDTVDATATDALIATSGNIGRVDVTRDSRWYAFVTEGHIWIAPVRAPKPTDRSEWIRTLPLVPDAADRTCGWSPDGRLLYLLLERDGFRDLYALRVDPATGRASGEPFVVHHIHDPRRRWGSTPYGTAIADNAFVFHQTEMTGRLWLLMPPVVRPSN
jgi:Tol biopolymer transport system component